MMKPDPLNKMNRDNLAVRIAALDRDKQAVLGQNLSRKLVDGHTMVAQTLKGLGITHVYCVSGTPIRETFARCGEAGIRLIGVRHQQAGVMMAIAQNYVTGRLTAISIVSAGPAVTNAMTGILVARDNCWPVILLGGRRPLSMQGMGSFQDLDAVPIYKPITKWSGLVETTSNIPADLRRAFSIATRGRPGPVYLDLPEDVLSGLALPADLNFDAAGDCPLATDQAFTKAADLLLSAKRPALIIGKGLRWSEPYDEISRLVNEYGIPFITSPMGRGYLPDDHPLCCNHGRAVLLGNADVVLLAGARLDWSFRFGSEFAPDADLIQIDIESSEIGVNKSPTVGILGDLKQVLHEILDEMARNRNHCVRSDVTPWQRILSEERKRKRHSLELAMSSDSLPMTPYRMFREIRDVLPRDAICILDGNISMAAAQQVLPAYLPASRITAGSNGCMGVGIPFGIGAKLARPDSLVVVICGDTAFAFNAMEMETALRHGISLIIIVVNNEGNCGALMQKSFPAGGERITMFQRGIRYETIMSAFGGHAEFVERPEEMQPALERAMASGKTACVNVQVDPYAPYPND
jgi:thiamine pyrophosphate-dependent acetolactate synthase large subunit-like protein